MAISSAVTPVRQRAPYALSGQGQRAGLWDLSAARADHIELDGRVTLMDATGSGSHATAVAGVIAAWGRNPFAQGMAPRAQILSFDWDNDTPDLAAHAATSADDPDGLYVTTHAYATLAGWSANLDLSGNFGFHWLGSYEDREDAAFGLYESTAAAWDAIAWQARYVLPVKMAGNDRDDPVPAPGETFYYFELGEWQSKTYDPAVDPRPDGWNDGGYGTITDAGCAKNTLTVGSVSDAVATDGTRAPELAAVAAYSGWGPVDDGRVKPDIMVNGAEVLTLSPATTAAYQTLSGTSMATAGAVGAALLITEQYHRAMGEAMTAAALKGLLLHTADDLGTPGPDYQTGWGLLNAQAAVDHIRLAGDHRDRHFFADGVLSAPDTPDTFEVIWEQGVPFRATLSWTDPAGPGGVGLNDPTPALVNDLDLRVEDIQTGTVYFPYTLDRLDPSAPAGAGDNVVDNVEQVYVAQPPTTGRCRITVSIKNAPAAPQGYALILSGQGLAAAPALEPEGLEFGDVPVGSTDVALSLTLRNTGPGPLLFDGNGLSITGSGASQFRFAEAPSLAPVPAGDSRVFRLACRPSAPGMVTAIFRLSLANSPIATLEAPLSATAVEATLARVEFAEPALTVDESTGGAHISLRLSAPAPAGGASVGFRIAGGTAMPDGVDYTLAADARAHFAAGTTETTFVLPITDDPYAAPDKTVTLQLSDAQGCAIGAGAEITVTITDSDTRRPGARFIQAY